MNDLIERAEAICAELQKLVRPKPKRHIGLWITAGAAVLMVGAVIAVTRVPTGLRIPD